MTPNARQKLRPLLAGLGVTAVYFCAGKFGLTLAFVQANATAVWAPTGIALAALLLLGYGVWPGIFLGAFLVNLTTAGSVGTSLGIATGNSLEALTGAFLVNRFANGRFAFKRSVEVFKFAVLAGMAGTLVSPTLGVGSLSLAGYVPHGRFFDVWLTWWLGDMGGALLVAPLLILGAGYAWRRLGELPYALELAGLLAAMGTMAWIEFGGQTAFSTHNYPLEIFFIPLLVWAAVRFSQAETAFASYLMTAFGVFGTLHGFGPFKGETPNESLLFLQAFMSVSGVMVLVLAANVAEKREARQALQRAHEELEIKVEERTRALRAEVEERRQVEEKLRAKSSDLELLRVAAVASNQAASLEEALEISVTAVCFYTHWPVGHVYRLSDSTPHEMIPTEIWYLEHPSRYDGFRKETQTSLFPAGRGLPGRILASGKAECIPNVAQDRNFPRLQAATQAGLKGAFGFPVLAQGQVVAVLEFFSEEEAFLDPAFLELMGNVGTQLGWVVERQKAALDLQNRERHFRALIENALDIVTLLDEKGTILFESPSITRFLGYSPTELNGTNAFSLIHPLDLSAVQQVFGEVLAKPENIRNAKFRFRHKDGTWRVLESIGSNLLGVEAIKAVVVNSRDVTREEEARRAIQEKEELTRSNKDLEQFAYVASHDLQEPLRMVASYVQLLARQYEGKLDAEADQYIHEAVDGAKRMQTLIHDLLAYSRVDSGGHPFTKVDCEEALRLTLANLETSLDEAKARVTHGPLPEIRGDFNQIVQLFQNLIANAVKFKGRQPPEIRVEAAERNGEWVFSVRDNGIGIDPAYSEKIFEVFKRLHTRAEYPGTGIGLAICKKVVARHGGRIWVESQEGKGAVFYWTLPLVHIMKEEKLDPSAAQKI